MSKKVSYGSLKNADTKYYTQKKVLINSNNNDYEVLVDEHFRDTKIQQLILEMTQKMQYCKNKGIEMNFVVYYPILLLKYFTNIQFPDEFEKQVQMFEFMLDADIIEPIFKNFDSKEIDKITERMKQSNDNLKELQKNPELVSQILTITQANKPQEQDDKQTQYNQEQVQPQPIKDEGDKNAESGRTVEVDSQADTTTGK